MGSAIGRQAAAGSIAPLRRPLRARVAALLDEGRLRTTVSEQLSPIKAAHLRRVHELVESGRMRGKLVLSGF